MIGVGLLFYHTHPRPSETPDVRTPDVVPAVEVSNEPSGSAGQTASLHHATPVARPSTDFHEDRIRAAAPVAPAPVAAAAHSSPALAEGRGGSGGSRDLDQAFDGVQQAQQQVVAQHEADRQQAVVPPAADQQAGTADRYRSGYAQVAVDSPPQDNSVANHGGTTATLAAPDPSTVGSLGNSIGSAPTTVANVNSELNTARESGSNGAPGRAPSANAAPARVANMQDDATRNRTLFDNATRMELQGQLEDARAQLQMVRGPAADITRAQAEIAQLNLRIQQRTNSTVNQVATAQAAAATPPAATPPPPTANVAAPPVNATPAQSGYAGGGSTYPGSSTASGSNVPSSIRRGAAHHPTRRSTPAPMPAAEFDNANSL
jgi:hypothetical protein